MKTATLNQIFSCNAGVLGEIKIGGLTLQTIETKQCLDEGEHILKEKDGRYFIDGDYRVLMDKNGPYRTKGLVVGFAWDHRSFDVKQKGDAMQALLRLVGDGMKINVIKPDTNLVERLQDLEEDFRGEMEETQDHIKALEEHSQRTVERLRGELEEVKSALKWAVAQTSPGKAATKAQAQVVIDKVLDEGEGDESDGDDSGTSLPAGE